mmetsp:Transcript_68892/g.192443  ORF Transcript_68892/g.192443 Transcript_68892/m.192443 type:complete len:305 (+) Transcript_68892:1352-2266(+)
MVKVDGAYCTERAADRRSKHLRRNCEACASSSINRASSAVDHSFGRTSPSPSSFPPSPPLPPPSSSSSHPRDCVGHSRPLFVRLDVPRPRNKNITYASLTHSLTDSLAHSLTHPLRLASGLRPRSTAAVLSRALDHADNWHHNWCGYGPGRWLVRSFTLCNGCAVVSCRVVSYGIVSCRARVRGKRRRGTEALSAEALPVHAHTGTQGVRCVAVHRMRARVNATTAPRTCHLTVGLSAVPLKKGTPQIRSAPAPPTLLEPTPPHKTIDTQNRCGVRCTVYGVCECMCVMARSLTVVLRGGPLTA